MMNMGSPFGLPDIGADVGAPRIRQIVAGQTAQHFFRYVGFFVVISLGMYVYFLCSSRDDFRDLIEEVWSASVGGGGLDRRYSLLSDAGVRSVPVPRSPAVYGVNGYRRDLRGPRPELVGNLNSILAARHRVCYTWLVFCWGYLDGCVCDDWLA